MRITRIAATVSAAALVLSDLSASNAEAASRGEVVGGDPTVDTRAA